jgi:hypothetical protein
VRLSVPLLLVALALPLRAGDFPLSGVASDRAALALLAKLLAAGGGGFLPTESTAFIVVDEGGAYRAVPWPRDNRPESNVFRGEVPPFTIAVAHTHPRRSRRPSAADVRTARSLGLPILVLTPRDIVCATPEGDVVTLIENRLWAGESLIVDR